MKERALVLVLAIVCVAQGAWADETWTCTFRSPISKAPMLVSYEIVGNELVQTWPTGQVSRFQVLRNNKYGLVGVSSISEIEPNQNSPTVGAMTVVIGKQAKEFWLTTAIIGESMAENKPVRGTCINK